MKVSEAFPSRYLAGDDLGGRRIEVIIREVILEEVGDEKENKPILYFEGKRKGMVLNKTNATVLAETFGDDMEDWTGRKIELRTEKVSFQGKIHNALRVQPVEPPAEDRSGDEPPF